MLASPCNVCMCCCCSAAAAGKASVATAANCYCYRNGHSPLLLDGEGGLHVVRRHGQSEVADGQVVPFHERSSGGAVLLENVLDLLQADTTRPTRKEEGRKRWEGTHRLTYVPTRQY